ncbi:hypothetical protein EC973_000527 [Apophysomyces ossiformis]|uniref:BZIP domain-containing protein n=1 Tax=Apophysomyces ossiformis TaxID=679940 RepID=A0A8H7BRH3_9FUNG|nr:hypothetical protein EC973_000527 [Apophysomyces ossiformis]
MNTKPWTSPAAEAWRMASINTLNQAMDPYVLTDTDLQRELAIFANAQFASDIKSDEMDKACDDLDDLAFLMKPAPPPVLDHEAPLPLDKSAASSTVTSPSSVVYGDLPWMQPYMVMPAVAENEESTINEPKVSLSARVTQKQIKEPISASSSSPLSSSSSSSSSSLASLPLVAPKPTASTSSTTSPTSKKKAKDPEYLDDKRRRNTAASARFRVKKKLREQAMQRTACEMTEKATRLEARVHELEREIQWLKSLIVEQNESRLEQLVKERPLN